MIVVMAEVANSPTLSHIILPEHIHIPFSWCEIVIASQDIMVYRFAKSVSCHEITCKMCIDGMVQDKNKYKKPMMSSEGSALVAMTASAVGEAPPLTLPKGREYKQKSPQTAIEYNAFG